MLKMSKSVKWYQEDFYCRYLDGRAFLPTSTGEPCNGRFGSFLKKRIGISRLPYGLSVSDLIVNQAVFPDLIVHLPREYFLNWENFPRLPAKFDPPLNDKLKPAQEYSIRVIPRGEFSKSELLHPYDQTELETEFVARFKINAPSSFKHEKHPNGRSFIPYEWYLSYWKVYLFVEALDGYEEIDRFLAIQPGQATLRARFTEVSEKWEERYKDTFTLLSFYRTAVTLFELWEGQLSITYGSLSDFLQEITGCTANQLEEGLEKLLILFKEWSRHSKEGRRYYPAAIELLRRDIDFLIEWLCLLTEKPESFYFDKWSYNDQQPRRWADIREVITYEDFELQRAFTELTPHYAESLPQDYVDDIQKVYDRLSCLESFWPWARAFSDLHQSLSHPDPLSFRQVRVLDYLLVITIRTEVLIRSILISEFSSEDDRDLRRVFNQFSQHCSEKSPTRRILGTISDTKTWKLTELSGKPNDIFGHVDSLPKKKGWAKSMHYMLISVLRFVTARNYFAHHSFKDESLNNQVSELASKVLAVCVETVLFIDSVVEGVPKKKTVS